MGLINAKRSGTAETKYTTLNGLYKNCEWDLKNVKKWIQEKKLAPLYPGQAEKSQRDLDECPICFLVPIHFPKYMSHFRVVLSRRFEPSTML